MRCYCYAYSLAFRRAAGIMYQYLCMLAPCEHWDSHVYCPDRIYFAAFEACRWSHCPLREASITQVAWSWLWLSFYSITISREVWSSASWHYIGGVFGSSFTASPGNILCPFCGPPWIRFETFGLGFGTHHPSVSCLMAYRLVDLACGHGWSVDSFRVKIISSWFDSEGLLRHFFFHLVRAQFHHLHLHFY